MVETQSPTPPHGRPERGMLARLLAAAIVGLIIMAECLITYLVLPSPQALSEAVQESASSAHDPSASATDPARCSEVPLGRFSITKYRPETNTSIRIEFNLVYTVLNEDKDELSKALASCTNRIRDRIIFVVRNSETSDISDPGLDLIKRRILETSNGLLGGPIVHSVIFSDFSFTEQ